MNERERITEEVNNSVQIIKLHSIVQAWSKINDSDEYTQDQKDIITRSAMAKVWEVLERKD